MFDDLRNSASSSFEEEPVPEVEKTNPRRVQQDNYFLGMTAPQRFVIALTLLFMTCALGGFCLILTNKIYLPFF